MPQNDSGQLMAGIAKEMQNQESMLWGKIAIKMAVGVPLALLVPFVVAVVLTLWAWAIDFGFNWFSVWFILACAGFFTLSWKTTRRHRVESVFAEEMIRLVGGDANYWKEAAPDEVIGKHQEGSIFAYIEMIFYGPREVIEAIDIIQGQRQFDLSAKKRAAEVVADLATKAAGVPWTTLRREGETVEYLLHILGYLKFSEWIDISADGKKIWLLSQVRKKLVGL